MDSQQLKAAVCGEVEAHRQQLIDLSLKIHADPELGFQETGASGWLCDCLERNGFEVERGICQLATAFRARYGRGKPAIAFIAEYDALPGIGHGCGHNIIAASAIGAGIAARLAVDRLGGSALVLGTPGEELYGGKVIMVARGAFEEVDAAMMVHPEGRDVATTQALACVALDVEFFGKAAHAAASPEKGVNALEAMVQAFNGINSLRQHIKDSARVHGIITDGGESPNVVPAHSAGSFLVRAHDDAYLDELRDKVLNCFKAASLASGARLEYRWGDTVYAAMCNNLTMAQLFIKNMETLGRRVQLTDPERKFGSTDMGNVSAVVPAIHPSVAIAPPGVWAHSLEFAAAAISEAGHKGLLDAAKAQAMVAVDLLAESQTIDRVKQEFYGARAL